MNGPAFPALGLGAGPLGAADLDEHAVRGVVFAALDAGLVFFDTARSYGASEERLGRLLAGRRDVVLATKGGYGVEGAADWTADAVRLGIERALRVLRVETLDVFFLHSCPLDTLRQEPILAALDAARSSGKVRLRGYSGDGDALAFAVRSGRFDVVECSVNLVDRAALAHAGALPIVAKRALLSGAFRHEHRPDALDVAIYWDRLRAARIDPGPLSWHDLALRFASYAPGVTTTLVGTTRPDHVHAAARARAAGPLDDAVRARLDAAWDPSWPGVI